MLQVIKRHSIVVIAVTAALLSIFILGSARASAQSSSDGTSNLKISPLRTDITVKPGNTTKVEVTVQNISSSKVTLRPIQNDFIAGGENGEPSIILDENEYAPTHSLKRFMQPIGNITLNAGERKKVVLNISVPKNAQAGGYYGALRFAPADAASGQNVSLSGSVASLVLLTVPGNVVENLTLKSFDVEQNGIPSSRFSTSKDLSVVIRLQNAGNVHVIPFGGVYVEKNGKLIYSGKINDIKPAGAVLPDSTRKFTIPLNDLGTFGRYKISATVGYGSNGETINIERSILIIPTLYIIGGVVAIVLLVGLILAVVLGLKSYKKRILRSTRRR